MIEPAGISHPVKLQCGVEIIPLPGNAYTTSARIAELQAYMQMHQADVVNMGGEYYVERAGRLPADALRNKLGTPNEADIPEHERDSILRSTNWVIDVTGTQGATEFHVHRVGEKGTTEGQLGGTRLLEFYSDKGCTLEFFRVHQDGTPNGVLEHIDIAPGACLVKFNATDIAHSFQAKPGGICLGVSNHPLDGIGSFGTEGIMNNTGHEGFEVSLPSERTVTHITPPETTIDLPNVHADLQKALGAEVVGIYDPRRLLQAQEGLEAALRIMDEPGEHTDTLRGLICSSLGHIKNAGVDKKEGRAV